MIRTRVFHVPGSSRAVLACALLALASSCDSGGDGGQDAGAVDAPAAPDAPIGVDGGGGVEAAAPTTPFCTSKPADPSVTTLSGTWVARVAAAQVVSALGAEMRNQTILDLLVDISQQGTQLVAEGRYCNREQISQGGLISVVLPDRWAHTETPVHRTGTFAVGTDGVPVLEWDMLSEVYGAVLVPPDNTLPTSIEDPRIVDEDGDGNPGITIAVTGIGIAGNLYVVQMLTTAIRAIPVAPDRLEGALTFTSQQNVLGTSSPSLTLLYSSSGGESRADPVVCNSGFTMVRVPEVQGNDGGSGVDGGAISCEWVRAHAATLFL